MLCPKCATPNPEAIRTCVACGQDLTGDKDGMAPTASGVTTGFDSQPASGSSLAPGSILANRYRIIAAIGMGGMGMVYKAVDLELSVPVALKVIRAEYAGNEKILERFKHEITIARRITHKNIARIYDMGESDGIRYISMEYIEGEDLARIIERDGALATEQVIDILRQCCMGLLEAHAQGVVHRDLKPHNVMIDGHDAVHVMDFGIAMSNETRGLTRTGAILGTAEYMSPEQAEGRKIDHRADIYSLGITIYEALTGTVPFSGETQWEVIRKQMQERPRAPRRLRADTPAWLETVVLKCLEKDPAHRYQSVEEILRDLDRQKATRTYLAYLPKKRSIAAVIGAITLAVIAATAAYMLRPHGITPGMGGRFSVAVLPFENQAARKDLDWLRTGLAENLSTDLAQSKYLRVITRERLNEIFKDLGRAPDAPIDQKVLKGISQYSGAQAIFTGSFVGAGDTLRINMLAQDPQSGEVINSAVVSGPDSSVLAMIDQLTVRAKEILSISQDKIDTDVDTAISAARTSSVEAARLFQKGVDDLYAGRNLEAVEPLEEATKQDSDFALAWARLSQAYRNLGYDQKAQEAGEKALSRLVKSVDKVNLADRAFVRAVHAASSEDRQGAIDAYTDLLNADPFDATAAYNLGHAYEMSGQWDEAEIFYKKARSLDDNYAEAQTALGRIKILSGHPGDSLAEFQSALDLYTKLGSKEGEANTYQAMCNAYIGLQKWDKALEKCDASQAIKKNLGDKRGLAATLSSKAYIQQVMGHLDDALQTAKADLGLSREIGDARGTAFSLTNLASILEDRGNLQEALDARSEALDLLRSFGDQAVEAETLVARGRLQIQMGRLSSAQADLLAAQKIDSDLKLDVGSAQANSDLGLLAFARGDLKLADQLLDQATGQWNDLKIEEGVSEAAYRKAGVALRQGLFGTSAKLATQALTDYRSAGDKLNTARCHVALASALMRSGDPAGAGPELEAGLEAAKALGNRVLLADTRLTRAELNLSKGDISAAASEVDAACGPAGQEPTPPLRMRCSLMKGRLALAQGKPGAAVADAADASREAKEIGAALPSLEADLIAAEGSAGPGKTGAGYAASVVAEKASRAGDGDLVLRSAPAAARLLAAEGRTDRLPRLAGLLEDALRATRADLPADGLPAFLKNGLDSAACSGLTQQLRKLGQVGAAASLDKLLAP